jgi:DNA helicase HerA-like ATPase
VLGGAEAARAAYAMDEIDEDRRLHVGLVKNGGRHFAGPGCIDLDYLLGENGGHLNVSGVAGRGTKSGFLLHVISLLLLLARRHQRERPADPGRLKVVPIILNVKNFDLFSIDRPSKRYDPARDGEPWRALGVDDPAPFADATFLAPQDRGSANPVHTGRAGVRAYSWSLGSVIEQGLFPYLFSEEDVQDDNFGGVVADLEARLTGPAPSRSHGHGGLDDQGGTVRTFGGLLRWFDRLVEGQDPSLRRHAPATLRKFQRRLFKVVHEARGVLRLDDPQGQPLDVRSDETRGPQVIDVSSLAGTPSLQRFVVAAIFKQLVEARTGGHVVPGLRYLVMLDELNRFAPRGGRDPITRLIETVAAEMRSQGIILLGAQQQASLVSARVFENAGIKAVGRSGSMEMGREIWRFLGESARRKAAALDRSEKLLVQDSFREPMLVRIPMPPWALNPHEAGPAPAAGRIRDEFDEDWPADRKSRSSTR